MGQGDEIVTEKKIITFFRNSLASLPNLRFEGAVYILGVSQFSNNDPNEQPESHLKSMTSILAATLAAKATTVSNWGINIVALTSPAMMAQGDLKSQMGGALGILNLVGLVLAFGGLLFAAVMFMMGQTERMIYGLVGALIGGLSFLIVKAMFQSSDKNVNSLQLGS